MPSFSRSLEGSLHRALALANEREHEYATLDHLLLSLADDPDAATAMRAASVDLDTLRQNLSTYIDHDLENLVRHESDVAKPTAGFQRVIQRAVIKVQSSGREQVSGADLFHSIYAERESHAAQFLREQDISVAERPAVAPTDFALAPPPADWPQWRRDELKANSRNPKVGTALVSKTDRVRVWLLTLAPGARLPFHRHVLDYFWTATAPGKAVSHYGDGRVAEITYALGDTRHLTFGPGESMIHDLENTGATELSFVTVEFLDSANQPLPIE
ncbi:MAG: hypothetical protein JOY94_04915 [Methylobacteriaceae bacterium]|nr:hypothetical protein [Methylobacteriaceae bacterium]